jgi:hypothetical protein
VADVWPDHPVVNAAPSDNQWPDHPAIEVGPQPNAIDEPQSSIPGWGRFGITAVTRGLGGAADFLTDPLAPLRRIVSPELEAAEQSAKFKPGEAAGNKFFEATGIPEYQPTTPAGRVGLAASEGLVGGGPFGVGGALLSGVGGVLGQTTKELTGSDRLATAASLLPAVLAPAARMGLNYGVDAAKNVLGPAMSKGYREGQVGEQLRSAASDPAAFEQSLSQPTAAAIGSGFSAYDFSSFRWRSRHRAATGDAQSRAFPGSSLRTERRTGWCASEPRAGGSTGRRARSFATASRPSRRAGRGQRVGGAAERAPSI